MPSYLLELTPDNIEYCQKFLAKRVSLEGGVLTLTHIVIGLKNVTYIEVSIPKSSTVTFTVITLNGLDIIRVLPTWEARRMYLEEIYGDSPNTL